MKSVVVSFIAVLSVMFQLFLVQRSFAEFGEAHDQRPSCAVCGMYIDEFRDTSTELTSKDGIKSEACGVACMLRIVNDSGGPDAFSELTVHDWNTKAPVPADDAAYVIGSRVIPDMVPNIIAFKSREEAEAFIEKEGGAALNFTQALLSISPMGMTMPTRIKQAVISPKGALAVGGGYMLMTMDKVQLGAESVDPLDFVQRPGQMMGPKKMTSEAEMVMINYSLTDDLSLGITEAYFEKKMESYKMGGKVTETTRNYGMGDVDVSLRYGLWKDVYYSKFFSLLAGATLPTGEFEKEFINMSGLQIGTGSFTYTGGLLYSQRYSDFWLHSMATYTGVNENSDDFKFGDTTRFGLALHYTPNYDVMTGLEVDGAFFEKDEFNSTDVDNSGGFRSNVAATVQWRFLTAFGGNFSVRATGGLPIYEDINHFKVGQSEKVKMGSGYFVNALISFSRRFPVY